MAICMCVFVCLLLCACALGHRVKTTEGDVEGYEAADGDYYEFYGIPYAGPTDGIHRFKGPKPPARHKGVFHANISSIICAQPSLTGIIGMENCLTLNIFTKDIKSPKPVIIWLNAEGYSNTTNQSPSFKTFVEKDLVFVSLNFRLSIFGFLCLGIQEAPGNAGLRDVIQGLKWIQNNIQNFGGDPNNIVLMGYDSGAAMVDIITMTTQAKGLVHKAIALSGSAIAPWAVAYNPLGYAEHLGAKLGYNYASKEELAQHLMATDIHLLNKALVEFSIFKNGTLLFAPCIENVILNPIDPILTDAPLNLLRSGNYLQIPYMTGYSLRPGMIARDIVAANWQDRLNRRVMNFLPVDLVDVHNKNRTHEVNGILSFYYFIGWPHAEEYGKQLLRYEVDTTVTVPVIRGAKERSLTSNAQVRLFAFGPQRANKNRTYQEINYFKNPLDSVKHEDLRNYIFDYDLKAYQKPVVTSIVQRFATFAYTGSQNYTTTPSRVAWLPITKYNLNCLDICDGDEPCNETLSTDPNMLTESPWYHLYDNYYQPPRAVNYLNSTSATNSTNLDSSVVVFISLLFGILGELFIFYY